MIDRFPYAARTGLALLVAGLLSVAAASPASATMISFTGTPDFLNLSPGASGVDRSSLLTGTITFSDAYQGGAFNAADVTGLDLMIGGLDFGAAGVPAQAALSGTTSAGASELDALFYQLTLPLSNARCAGCSLNLAMGQSPDRFSASYNTLNHGSGILTGDFSATTATAPSGNTAIPEPPAWLLFGFGLALVGWGVRRRRAM